MVTKKYSVAAACQPQQLTLIENCCIKAFSLSCERETARSQHEISKKLGRARYLVDKKLRLLQKLADIDEEILILGNSAA